MELAASAVPVDVRQVRINVGDRPAATTMSGPSGAAAGTDPSSRNNDLVVELRGTVGLATFPDEKVFGLAPEAQPEAQAEAQPEVQPEVPPEAQPPGRPPE